MKRRIRRLPSHERRPTKKLLRPFIGRTNGHAFERADFRFCGRHGVSVVDANSGSAKAPAPVVSSVFRLFITAAAGADFSRCGSAAYAPFNSTMRRNASATCGRQAARIARLLERFDWGMQAALVNSVTPRRDGS
jgi:hypothetical protein